MSTTLKIINAKGGQSNIVGNQQFSGFSSIYLQERTAKAWIYGENRDFLAGFSNNEDTFSPANDQAGFELSEFYTLEQIFDTTSTELHMVKMGIGGSQLAADGSLTDWAASSSGEYSDIWIDRIITKITYEIKKDQKLGSSPKYWVPIDWHQGEADSQDPTDADNYRVNIEALKNKVDAAIIAVFTKFNIPTNKYQIDWFMLELNQISIGDENDVRQGVYELISETENMYLKPSGHLDPDDPNRVHYSITGYTDGGIEHANFKKEIFTRTSIPEYPLVIMFGEEDALGIAQLSGFSSTYTTAIDNGFMYNDTNKRMLYNESGFNNGQSVDQGGFEMSLNFQLKENFDKSYIYKRGVVSSSSSSWTEGQSNYNFTTSRMSNAIKLVVAHGYKPKIFYVPFLGRNDGNGASNNYATNMQNLINSLRSFANNELSILIDRDYSDPTFIWPYLAHDNNGRKDTINGHIDTLVSNNNDVYLYDTLSLDVVSGENFSPSGYTEGGIGIGNLIASLL